MKFNTARSKLAENEIRHRNILESDECAVGTHPSMQQQQVLINTLSSTPSLLMCGPIPFQTMKMWHDGVRWIMELVAVYQE